LSIVWYAGGRPSVTNDSRPDNVAALPARVSSSARSQWSWTPDSDQQSSEADDQDGGGEKDKLGEERSEEAADHLPNDDVADLGNGATAPQRLVGDKGRYRVDEDDQQDGADPVDDAAEGCSGAGQIRGQCAGVHRSADAHGINRGDDDVEQEERTWEVEAAGFANAVRQRKAKVLADPAEPAQREGVEQKGEE